MSNEKKKNKISRRQFIVRSLAGGVGLMFGATYFGRHSLRRSMFEMLETMEPSYLGDTSDPLIWFEIMDENRITFHSPKVEMGQGTFTGLAQIAADELNVDLEQITVVHAATATGNVDGLSTGGSLSISGLWHPLRELAATMRQMLTLEAAKKLGVPADTLSVSKGIISDGVNSIGYSEVVQGVESWEIPETPPLKDISEYKYVGQPIPRLDLVDKVVGEPIFGIDVDLPDMLYGAVARPQKIGATFAGADTTKAEKMSGVVKVLVEKDFVGVVASSMVEANLAKQAIDVTWNVEGNWQTEDISKIIEVGKGEAFSIQKVGDADGALEDAEAADDGSFFTAKYSSPIGAHAQLEPNGAVAHVEGDKAKIYISTQVPKITRDEVAARLGFDEENVNIVPTYLGGGFGRRLHTPNAIQAALLSKAAGKPVKCFYDRKEEFQNDTFRSPTHHTMKAKLNSSGMMEALEHNFSSGDVMFGSPLFPAIMETVLGADAGALRGGAIQYDAVPNYQATNWRVKLPFATSWWRSLGLLANTFAIESFIDELAEKAGKDPVEFRLSHISDSAAGKRLKKVIQTAADKGGYTNIAKSGHAMGFAASVDAQTPCAHVVDLSIEGNEIKVHKVTCVIDPGMAVNPDQVKAQCEGAIIMGLSASLYEKMYVEDNQLRPINYGAYRMALMKNSPKEIDVIILENADAPGAVGEPPLGPIGAAIANAVYRLTGKRYRDMPIEPG
ncbi:MAG: molybdopterin cofactor-binding domain-containing protein [Calditrichia bacterium]